MSQSFASFQLSEPLLEVLKERQINSPTPVQAEAIPAILAGKDALIESPTGTGKTLAYLLPICSNLTQDSKDVQALILAPTHELVMQISREAEQLLDKIGLTVVPLIGGVDPKRQLEKLKKHPAVLVATPGRLRELLEQRKVKVHAVKTVVLDEADRMMDSGFSALVQDVMKRTLRDTQRLFFSATLPDAIVQTVKPMVKDPVLIRSAAPETETGVLHFYLVSEGRKKVDTLRRLLRLVDSPSSIVFVNEIERVEDIVSRLKYHHLECRFLHRDASKEDRALTLQQFRARKFPVLITTDIAARGIDIPGVECIVHFDPATDADAYIHRSGRTGRMGAPGLVFSIITAEERFIINKFTKQTNIPIAEKGMTFGSLVDPGEQRNSGERRPRVGKPTKPSNPAVKSKRSVKPGGKKHT